MTRDDIEHLAQVCESLKAQCKAQEGGFRVDRDFDYAWRYAFRATLYRNAGGYLPSKRILTVL